jgi:hypothetical protein
MLLAWFNLITIAYLACRVCQTMEQRSQAIPCMLLPELGQRLHCPGQFHQVSGAINEVIRPFSLKWIQPDGEYWTHIRARAAPSRL